MADNIYKKLANVQAELVAPKNLTNKFGGYQYRSAEGILESVKPLLKKYNLLLTVSDRIYSVEERVYVEATVRLIDTAGGENNVLVVSASARESLVKKGMDESQITGAASSYARKYALNGMFAIDDVKDADATNDGSDVKPKQVVKPQPTKADLTRDQYEAVIKAVEAAGLPNLSAIEQKMDKYNPNGKMLKQVRKVIENKFKSMKENK